MTPQSKAYTDIIHAIADLPTEQRISVLTRLLSESDTHLSPFERNDLQATITNERNRREQHEQHKLGPQYGTNR